MSEPQYGRYDSIARRWLALIERRQEHFLDLCDSGRWRHYFTEAEFLDEMRKVLRVRDQWAAIAGRAARQRGSAAGRWPTAAARANGVAAPAWPD